MGMVNDSEYKPRDDFAKSIEWAYREIKRRVAEGGKPWQPSVREIGEGREMSVRIDNIAERTIAGWGDGWRPIEAAPKDGTSILAYVIIKNSCYEGTGYMDICCWSKDDPDKPGKWRGCGVFNDQPTYWMPLPRPPDQSPSSKA